MKVSLILWLKNRAVLAGAAIGAIALIAVSTASSGPVGGRIKLEGAWIAQVDNGARAMVTYGPSDPSGQSATFHSQIVFPPAVLAGMGLDGATDEIAEEFMTGNNTTSYTGVWYGLVQGNIVAIFIDNATCSYDSPTKRTNKHTVSVYPAIADADNDGFPDPGAQPWDSFESISIGTRVIH